MCGIFGVVLSETDKIPDEDLLRKTARLIQHRGPDSTGVYNDKGIGLAHTRLSLLDLSSRSDQPFWDAEGRYCIVYNGEVYNFKDIRAMLEEKHQVRFRTTSDTEVILEYLIHEPPETALPQLEGMFAFVFYDSHKKTLLLARDRYGIKPLYYYQDDSLFLFASEIIAMRPWIEFEYDLPSISAYLMGYFMPTKDLTFYKNIRFLAPGKMVKMEIGGKPSIETYFELTDFWDPNQAEELRRLSDTQMVDLVEELLVDSVKMQLIADAPVGALLSGGVDSTLITAIAAKHHRNLTAFHVNVVGPKSEYEYDQIAARDLKVDMKVTECEDHHFIDMMYDVSYHNGHPFLYHPNSIPFLALTRLVRQNNFKAILTGEGSDESYLGYFEIGRGIIMNPYYRALNAMRRLVQQIPKVGKLIWPESQEENLLWVRDLHSRAERNLERQEIKTKIDSINGGPAPDKRLQTLNWLNYHLRTVLHRNDAMGMAASIEARFPFLNNQLIKTAVNMPFSSKIRFSPGTLDLAHPFIRDKWVLRKVAERYLSPSLSMRKKYGFPVEAYEKMTVSPAYFTDSFIVDAFKLSKPVLKFLLDNATRDMKLRLLTLDVWSRVCLADEPREPLMDKLKQNLSLR